MLRLGRVRGATEWVRQAERLAAAVVANVDVDARHVAHRFVDQTVNS
jgi:hypothetical protein